MNEHGIGYGIAPAGHRLPDATRLGPVRLQVASIDRSVAFYTTVLGLRVASRNGDNAVLSPQDDAAPLIELVELPGATPVAPQAQLGLYHFAILVPDRAALGRVFRNLLEQGVRPGAADHLVSEALYLSDPDGLGIEVYADRPRAEWRVQGRELMMDSKPLDTQGVLAAAGAAGWSGMPAGTVIGHVHLHVRDLEEAALFYHDAFGLDRIVWSYPGALFLSAGGYHHHLGLNTWAGPRAPLPEATSARMLEWQVIVPTAADVTQLAGSIETSGYSVVHDGADILSVDPVRTMVRVRANGAGK